MKPLRWEVRDPRGTIEVLRRNGKEIASARLVCTGVACPQGPHPPIVIWSVHHPWLRGRAPSVAAAKRLVAAEVRRRGLA